MKIFSIKVFLIILSLLFSTYSSARCVSKNSTWTGRDQSALGTQLGNINITSDYLQPVGTLLSSSVISFSQSTLFSDPNTVLYECDASDKNDIYEMFATNGDEWTSGYNDLGAIDGYPNYFGTWIPYTGLKLTHLNSGQPYTRFWQQYPITTYGESNGKIQIRLKDLSPIKAEIIKVSTLSTRGGSTSNWCTKLAPTTGRGTYSCNQPNAYTVVKLPGFRSYPPVGADSNRNYTGFSWQYWLSIGLNGSPASTYSHSATCVLRNVTPVVIFPAISVSQLNAGEEVSSQFRVEVECDNASVSGIANNQTSMGLQVTPSAYQTAKKLNLVTSKNAVRYLLSDGYGIDSSIATGVGIELSAANNGQKLNFVGWSNCVTSSVCGASSDEGWFPVLTSSSSLGGSVAGYKNYMINLTATLKKLPNQSEPIVPGIVDAKAYVLIKVQ
ncbi:fimbrial protein [Providencia burhodogranariea]|uniref:Fimbrial-type adhesion domain-containing protein n=1 Tax=Providencia burhodogranariea DSM 19968 TaxID=1141662 RepID=K8WVK3_9GAMM|nr:fimbrial protein [Providencia burhodogranariea]EKT60235.1 hypothetical protein OOA_12500 [Providencia burhodogranariea DSM 19968]